MSVTTIERLKLAYRRLRVGANLHRNDALGALFRAWAYTHATQLTGDYYEFGVYRGNSRARVAAMGHAGTGRRCDDTAQQRAGGLVGRTPPRSDAGSIAMGGAPYSALLQVAAAAAHAPQWLLWLRFSCVLAMAAASLHLCGLRLNVGGHAALLLVPVAWTVWQRRSLLHATLPVRA
ncbi:hypothetical protein [Xanthomonas arboricola]|uniref:hypothetical protein n=1 Tax=Xanthomonas arboricola TaxID=56448 RepID=UPI00215883F8|nr:hypothetical protein [Xanthomonas arboricola]